jgi:hypothetical protein
VPETPQGQKVVIAYLDRRRDRGLVYDFKASSAGFTLHPPDDAARSRGDFIEFRGIKAVYFVKSFEGNRNFKENKLVLPAVHPQGRKITVSFPDGERIVGITEGFLPGRPGFFFFPADPASNNLQIFAVTANVDEVRVQSNDPEKPEQVHRPNAERGEFLPEKRLEAVQRVLRGEPVEKVAKEMYVAPETLAGWRARYLSGGAAALGVTKPAGPSPGPKIR